MHPARAEHTLVDSREFAVRATDTTVDVDSPLGSTAFAIVPRFSEPGDTLATGSLVGDPAVRPGTVRVGDAVDLVLPVAAALDA